MKQPSVSVCVPSYNHEHYIGACIESALRQTVEPIDIVVVDDCSTDRTADIVADHPDSRVRLVRHDTNMGPSVALNRAIGLSQGDYVCILGSDDRLTPNKIERQRQILIDNPTVGVVFSFIQPIDENDNEIRGSLHQTLMNQIQSREQHLRNFFTGLNSVAAPSAMIRKTALDKVGTFDDRLLQTQDLDMWIRICLNFDVAVIPESLLHYRVSSNGANLSFGTPEKSARTLWELGKVLHRFRAMDREAFFVLFPESEFLKNTGLPIDALLAHQAIAQPQTHVRTFGIDLLFEVLTSGIDRAALDALGLGYRRLFEAGSSAAVISRMEYDRANALTQETCAKAEIAYAKLAEARDWWHATADQWAEQSSTWQTRAVNLGWTDEQI